MYSLIYVILFFIGGFITALINPSLSVIVFIAELNWDKDIFSNEMGIVYLIGATFGTLVREDEYRKERGKR